MRVVWALAVLLSAPAAAGEIRLLYYDRPPLYAADGHGAVQGIVAGRVARAMAEAGIAFRWERQPAAVHLRMVAEESDPVCAVGWFRTPAREGLGKFSAPVYRDRPMVALVRAGDREAAGPATLAEMFAHPTLRFGAKRGYSYGPLVDRMIAGAGPVVVETVRSVEEMAGMLVERRMDWMLVADEEADALRAAAEAAGGRLAVRRFPDMPPGNLRYLICDAGVGDDQLAAFAAHLPPLER